MPIARPAAEAPRYVKALIWGEPGSKKTRLALSFPNPIVADLEEGTQHYAAEFGHWMTTPRESALNEVDLVATLVRELRAGEYPDRQTLVIDPATLWLDQLERALIKKIGGDPANLSGMKKAEAYHRLNKQFEAVVMDIISLPMNVVFVARDKNVWGKDAEGKMAPIAKTYAGKDSIEWLADLVLRMRKGAPAEVMKCRLASLDPEVKLVTFADLVAAIGDAPPAAEPTRPIARLATDAPDPTPPASAEPRRPQVRSAAGMASIKKAREAAGLESARVVDLVSKMFAGRVVQDLNDDECDQVCVRIAELNQAKTA